MAASRTKTASEDSSNSIMQILLDRVKEDPESSVFFDDICEELNLGPQGERTMFGKYLKVLFPHVKSRRVGRGTGANRTKCKLFEGIALRTQDELRSTVKREALQLCELIEFVPNRVLVLSSSPVELILGVPSTLFCNGNLVLKVITITDNKWELSISGSAVGLKSKHFQISDEFFADREGLENVISIVRKLRVCCGYPVEIGREIRESMCKKLSRERSTFEGHVDVDVLRTYRCERILTFAQYKNTFCRQCFQDCHELHRDKVSEEELQENKKSSAEDAVKHFEADVDTFADGPAQMKQFLKCQLDALKCYAANSGKGQTAFPYCWDRTFLSLCMSMWMASKQAYRILESSGMMVVPTVRQLLEYKKKMLAATNPEEILPRLPQKRYQWRRFFSEQAVAGDSDSESELGRDADSSCGLVFEVSQGKMVEQDQQSQEIEVSDGGNSSSSVQLKMDCECEEAEHDFDMSASNDFDECPDECHCQPLSCSTIHQKNQETQTKYTTRSPSKLSHSQAKERALKRVRPVSDKHPEPDPRAARSEHSHSQPDSTEDTSEEDDLCVTKKPTLLKLSRAIFQFHSLTASSSVSRITSGSAATSTSDRTTTVANSGAAHRASAQRVNEPFPVALFPAPGHVHQSIHSNPNKRPFTPAPATMTRFPVFLLPPQTLALAHQSDDSNANYTNRAFTVVTENCTAAVASTGACSTITNTATTTSASSITTSSALSVKVESPSSPVQTRVDL